MRKGTGRWITRGERDPHVCRVPGWRERRRQSVGAGAIWKCDCGQHWSWTSTYASEGALTWERISPAQVPTEKVRGIIYAPPPLPPPV